MAAKTLTLESAIVPPKKSGRKPKQVDSELFDLLVGALENPDVVDGRPTAFGPPTLYDTEGKATAEARRYVKALCEVDNAPYKDVQISVRAEQRDDKWVWKIYRRVKKSDSSSNSHNGSGS